MFYVAFHADNSIYEIDCVYHGSVVGRDIDSVFEDLNYLVVTVLYAVGDSVANLVVALLQPGILLAEDVLVVPDTLLVVEELVGQEELEAADN